MSGKRPLDLFIFVGYYFIFLIMLSRYYYVAAHCFLDARTKEKYPPNRFEAVFAKTKREHSVNEENAQRRDVSD